MAKLVSIAGVAVGAGLMYVLDRTTGEFIQGKPFVKVNWTDGFDAKGRPHRVPGKVPAGSGGDGSTARRRHRAPAPWSAPRARCCSWPPPVEPPWPPGP